MMKRFYVIILIFLGLSQTGQMTAGGGIFSPEGESGNPGCRPAQGNGFVIGPANQVCSGVNIHFTTGHGKDLDMIAAAGFDYIRTDFIWQDIEYERGSYNWSSYDTLTAELEKRGLKAVYILDYSNSLYEDSVMSKDPITSEEFRDIAAPAKPESVAAFVRWARAAAIRFRDKAIVWEIWNEPNISFWRPVANVGHFNTLALAVCEGVKTAVPGSVIIGPATSQIPIPFLKAFLESGVLKYLDGVSVHPYRDYSLQPESAGPEYREIEDLIKLNAPQGKKKIPVISSEWGYASCPKGVTPERQAVLAVRMQLSNLLNGVPLSVWYDWKNDGGSPSNFEHNCGTVTYDLSPKPAYKAISTLNGQLKGLSLAHRITLGNEDDYALLFISRQGVFRICAWTTGKPHTVRLDLTMSHPGGIKAADGYGKSIDLHSEPDGLFIDLDEMPQYITLPCGIRLN